MQLKVGDIVEGKITGITNFGLFADIGDGKSGMVHISEVAKAYVNDIHDFVKENDVVKMKVLSIGENGKISLSIKRAAEPEQKAEGERRQRPPKRQFSSPKPDGSFVWGAKKEEPASFEEMMNKFKATSDDKFSDLKRKNPDAHRTKRGGRQ